MRHLSFSDGGQLPVLGLGTWRMGEEPDRRTGEIQAVRSAIDMGWRLIDTAEMYGEGGAEEVVGQALRSALSTGSVARDALFITSKVYPHNASRRGTRAACERSLKRLGLDRLDLYLLHWRGQHPLAETVEALRELVQAGLIARWGVSNFDTDDMQELAAVCGSELDCAANQVYLSPAERGPEFSLLPWLRDHRMPLMAYSPIDQGALATHDALAALARSRGVSAAQLALAWLVSKPGVCAIPKASSEAHLRDNLAAADLRLTDAELAQMDRLFPPPRRKTPLAML